MTVDEPFLHPDAFVPSSPGRRVAAFLLDLAPAVLIGGGVGLALIASAFGQYDGTSESEIHEAALFSGVAVFVLVPIAMGVLNLSLMARRGYSFGMGRLGMRVLYASTGRPLEPGKLLLRSLVLFAPVPLGYLVGAALWLVGPIVIAVVLWIVLLATMRGPAHRGWHDRAAGSVVVDVAPRDRLAVSSIRTNEPPSP